MKLFILFLLLSTAAYPDLFLSRVGDSIDISWTPSPNKVYTLMSSDSLNSEFQVIDGYVDTHLEKDNYTELINSHKNFFILNEKDIADLILPLKSGDICRFLYPNDYYLDDPNRVKYEDLVIIDQTKFLSIQSSNRRGGETHYSYGSYEISKAGPNEIDTTYVTQYEVEENGRVEIFIDVPTVVSIVNPAVNSGISVNAPWPEGLPFTYNKANSDNLVPLDLIGIQFDLLLLDAYDFIRSTNLQFTSIDGGLYTSGSEALPFTYSFNKINYKLGVLDITALNTFSNNNFNLSIKLVFTDHLKGYCYSEYTENDSTQIMCGFFGQDSFPVETYNEIPFSEMHIVQDYFADGKIDSYDLAYQKIISFESDEAEVIDLTFGSLDRPIIFPQIHRSTVSSTQLIDLYNADVANQNSVDLVAHLLSDGSYNFISVQNHPLSDYNGDYFKQNGLINDRPYFKSANQKYLYFYKGASGGIWSWSFNSSMPDGISDSFTGGWINPYSELKTGNFYLFEY